MIDVARLRCAAQCLAVPPQLMRPECKAQVGCGQLRRVRDGMAERAVVVMALMSHVIATKFRRRDAEDHLMDGPGIAVLVGSHQARRNNARHRKAKAKRKSEDDRGSDRHAKDMPVTAVEVNGIDVISRRCFSQTRGTRSAATFPLQEIANAGLEAGSTGEGGAVDLCLPTEQSGSARRSTGIH